jgi:AhpD family alkylhydroperoxidase
MQARMKHPVMILPDAMQAMLALNAAIEKAGVPKTTLELVHVRASQINGCGLCLEMHTRNMQKAGETDQRLFAVAAWRDTPYFTEAERAALALAESVTRLSDREDPVPDYVWNEVAKHYDEAGLAALLVAVGAINVWNRLNVSTRQVAGTV